MIEAGPSLIMLFILFGLLSVLLFGAFGGFTNPRFKKGNACRDCQSPFGYQDSICGNCGSGDIEKGCLLKRRFRLWYRRVES